MFRLGFKLGPPKYKYEVLLHELTCLVFLAFCSVQLLNA
jgi:hypothetical protein